MVSRSIAGQSRHLNLAVILRGLRLSPVRGDKQLTLYAPNSSILSEDDKLKPQPTTVSVDAVYQKKIKQELTIYEKQVNVHDLPDIFHYWSNKHISPMCQEAGFSTIANFFSTHLMEANNRTRSTVANFISFGAGNCDLEVSIAKNMVNAGFNSFIFECLEINPAMLERGKKIAKENDLLSNMLFVEADFNAWVALKKYDGVMANQSLHHVTRLEYLFDKIKQGLHNDGSFVISDIIGRNGHQRWPESLEVVNKYWTELPENYKFNVLLNRLEKKYDNWDCSKEGFEGIRAQDILPLLLERFQCENFVGYGSAIDVFVDRAFGPNFNRESEWDRDFIDRVHAEDEDALMNGKLTPTHMFAVFAKTLNKDPYYSRGINPAHSIRKPFCPPSLKDRIKDSLIKRSTQGTYSQGHEKEGHFIKSYLPHLPSMSQEIRNGRNVYEGYQRGWGLQFGDLRAKIMDDPLYKEAFEIAKDRTIMSEENRMNIFLLLRFFLPKIPFGHIIEYGAYRGGSAIFIAYVVQELYPGMKVFALDSFEGMPQTDKNIDAHNAGDFADADLDKLQARVDELKLDNLVLVKGLFENTNDGVIAQAGKISLAHIDCDIAPAVKYSYEGVMPSMVDGGYIVFDDATVSSCIGATEVVEDLLIRRDGLNSEQIWPHFVFRAFNYRTGGLK